MSPKRQRGPDGTGDRRTPNEPPTLPTPASQPGKQNDGRGDETRPVRARYSIHCFLPPAAAAAAARAPPSPSSSPGTLASPPPPTTTGGGRECGSWAARRSFPSPPGGRPRRGSRPAGRGMGGRDD